ncbi:MAG: 2-amino-4-hydroxy-6-hydroxymethyldihydropteridine diphosphokinase [Emcibacter sp.]|nr:2-amino-4-hydroxy-6-hydroxymethyldihydropteridine diphosphokinase [Emcibacter sp.]
MILIGLGSNLASNPDSNRGGQELSSPRQVLKAALKEMPTCGITVKQVSYFYESAPVPMSDQPWFVNGVAAVETALSPADLLEKLHEIEHDLGRKRHVRWEARIIDLDIIAYDDQILPSLTLWAIKAKDLIPDEIVIPHPRMHDRLFVLKPLMDICPDWTHPVLGKTVESMIGQASQDEDQSIRRMGIE